MPEVSVIMPVYNTEKYLRECLDSIINQTLKDIEIICVDDGSKDDSGKILDEYAQKDNRIKVIHNKNQGAAPSRNQGISIAQGKYLSILDSDDIFDTNMLELLFNKAEQNDADITICKSQGIDMGN
ncbi:MAG: glycosyltransferase, partial [Candidatus Gastranaerophilales bacterium]|nr:glycosyltransferase [Candidatus Gastranaerophilales bacterium]